MENLFVFVMAGGSGERFWPMSRAATPKHLLRLVSEKTLLEEAVIRALAIAPAERVFVLTNAAQVDACRAAVGHIPPEQFVADPAKRDPAPAAALATALAGVRNPDAVCALFPADSMIHDSEAFGRQVLDAAEFAAGRQTLVTFAIPPAHPSTAFGYLDLGKSLASGKRESEICAVNQFVEKPDFETAQRYVEAGSFGWNAGMFVWSAAAFLDECARLNPPLADFIRSFPEGNPEAYLAARFPHLPRISVDYAIMEQAREVAAVRATFDWDDVGSWTALPALLGRDSKGNTIQGDCALLDAENNIVIANARHIALCGVNDLIVVETKDSLLVCHRDAAQAIKKLQPLLPDHLK